MVAYAIGMTQSSIYLGLAYGIFDAIIVVWMRKPLSNLIRNLINIRGSHSTIKDVYVADVA